MTMADPSQGQPLAPEISPAAGSDSGAAASTNTPLISPSNPNPKRRHWRRWIISGVAVVVVIVAVPGVLSIRNTVSTDDAYVNGHVTFVAPRVAGQITAVLVDDNNRVHKGDVLMRLDPEPYQAQVNIAQAAVEAARADLTSAEAQTRAQTGETRSLRFGLEHAIQDVDNQVALLRSKVATVHSRQATLTKAQADLDRALPLLKSNAIAKEVGPPNGIRSQNGDVLWNGIDDLLKFGLRLYYAHIPLLVSFL